MYRPCVGILLVNHENRVFIGKRHGSGEGGGWQMPQGGIDAGEEPLTAAFRELHEETGVKNASLIKVSDHWYSYDLPDHASNFKGKYKGQRQKWVAFRFLGSDDEITIDLPNGSHPPEFEEWRWEDLAKIPDLIVAFKREVYEKVVAEFSVCLK